MFLLSIYYAWGVELEVIEGRKEVTRESVSKFGLEVREENIVNVDEWRIVLVFFVSWVLCRKVEGLRSKWFYFVLLNIYY